MGFLDNSGDIILDAVLTDLGRKKLAAGDGSFRIVKFALSDEEIDYSQYDKTQSSGQEDLDILATPVFEAFTNNASTMKSLLLSIPRTDLLFLPIFKINTETGNKEGRAYSNSTLISNGFAVSCTPSTNSELLGDLSNSIGEFIFSGASSVKNHIVVDQGIDADNEAVSKNSKLSAVFPELVETQFMLEIDNRLGSILDADGISLSPSFIDDDNIATYIITGTPSVSEINAYDTSNNVQFTPLLGSPGNRLKFSIKASSNLQSGDSLFTLLGQSTTISGATYKKIVTNVTVTGMTTGYSIEVPVAFYKYISG